MGREAIKIPTIRSVYGDQIICDGGAFGVGRQGGMVDPYYPVGSDCTLYHAYWDGTATDHSGNSNDGTVVGPSFGEYGLTFDGTDDYITLPNNASLDPGAADYSFIFWANLDAAAAMRRFILWNYGDWFYCHLSAAGSLQSWYAADSCFVQSSNDVGSFGAWKMFAVCIDRDAFANSETYVNALNVTLSSSGNDSTSLSFATQRIGYTNTTTIKGILGEALFFNTCKSSTFITDYFNATKARYGVA